MSEKMKSCTRFTQLTRGVLAALALAMLGGCLYSNSTFSNRNHYTKESADAYIAEVEAHLAKPEAERKAELRAEQSARWASGQYSGTHDILADYATRLANDPELAIIRGKSGISFTGNPVDPFDDKTPSQAERVAIRKYERLMREYYGKLCAFDLEQAALLEKQVAEDVNKVGGFFDLIERVTAGGNGFGRELKETPLLDGGKAAAYSRCNAMNQRVEAVAQLYSGKLTWAQYGRLNQQIDNNLEQRDIQRTMESAHEWDARRAREREAREAAQKKRNENEERELRRRALENAANPKPRSTSTSCYQSGGTLHCTTY
jgi:hypothetical protein